MDISEFAKETVLADLEKEMRASYLDYAMSVIVGRALPDVRDGLKPVHRRILYAMSEMGNDWNKPYKKSARIVGDVIGKYHPHGDSAIYDAIVRMAQDFSLRYPLIDGQGNFGSVDGDSPAAMRYTEIRLSRIAHELLENIDNETIDFGPNYDETERQPLVLPARLPNLLVNGSDGIAVGMATKIPPHNLSEVISACLALIDDSNLGLSDLMEFIGGPDFPTGAIINGHAGIIDAYRDGRGSIRIRAKSEIVPGEKSEGDCIVISELPFQVNKARLIEKIASLVREKKVEGIRNLRDESDKSGMRVVIALKSDAVAEVVLNYLYIHTKLETAYGINFVALANNQPRRFSLKDLLGEFIEHRREVTRRRLLFELRKAKARAHILEGLAIALSNLDEIIAAIRRSGNRLEAVAALKGAIWPPHDVKGMLGENTQQYRPSDIPADTPGFTIDGYLLSDAQAAAIVDMRLHRLTGLERQATIDEFKSILEKIETNIRLLNSPQEFMNVIKQELKDLRDQFAKNDERRTQIVEEQIGVEYEDMIKREDMVVTISHEGYAKRHPVSGYSAQMRGGKGRIAATSKDDDFISTMFVANTHNTLLCFTSAGKVFQIKVYQLQLAGRTARGRPLVNLLQLGENEKVTSVLPLDGSEDAKYIVMATRAGRIKKCELKRFANVRSNGLRAIELRDEDKLAGVSITDGEGDVMLFSNAGRAIRFPESSVRSMGRTARGVKGMKLESGQKIISMILVPKNDKDSVALLISSDGLGKRTCMSDFPQKGRAGKGVVTLPSKKRGNTETMGALMVSETDELVLITDGGTLIRMKASNISIIGRSAAGVRLMRLHEEEALVGAAIVVNAEDDSRRDIEDPNPVDDTAE